MGAFLPDNFMRREGLEALPARVAIVDARGVIVLVNQDLKVFSDANGAKGDPRMAVGTNNLSILRATATQGRLARSALTGIEAVLDGRPPEFRLEHACHAPGESRWCLMTVSPLDPNERMGAVISHAEITERIVAEMERQASDARFRAVYEHAPIGVAEPTPGPLAARQRPLSRHRRP